MSVSDSTIILNNNINEVSKMIFYLEKRGLLIKTALTNENKHEQYIRG